MIKRRQRAIRPEQWTDPGLLNAPKGARLTGMGLWGVVDDQGRAELRPELIAGAIYPGDPSMTPAIIEQHVLELDQSGFLTIYMADGATWLQLARPLVTQRPSPSSAPPIPELSGNFMAVGGARARADERVRAELAARSREWEAWAVEQEKDPAPPARPLLLDAPPIGCPDHPNGRYANCGPCGTARRRHDKWVAQQRYQEQLEHRGAEQSPEVDPDEPF